MARLHCDASRRRHVLERMLLLYRVRHFFVGFCPSFAEECRTHTKKNRTRLHLFSSSTSASSLSPAKTKIIHLPLRSLGPKGLSVRRRCQEHWTRRRRAVGNFNAVIQSFDWMTGVGAVERMAVPLNSDKAGAQALVVFLCLFGRARWPQRSIASSLSGAAAGPQRTQGRQRPRQLW